MEVVGFAQAKPTIFEALQLQIKRSSEPIWEQVPKLRAAYSYRKIDTVSVYLLKHPLYSG
jgi:hypothetical protein